MMLFYQIIVRRISFSQNFFFNTLDFFFNKQNQFSGSDWIDQQLCLLWMNLMSGDYK